MKLSARNQFKGTIVEIIECTVNGIGKIDIGGTAYAVIKATSVMAGVDD